MSHYEPKLKMPNPYFPGVFDVNAQEVLESKDQCLLIDVREPAEFTGELAHVPGSQLMPLGSLPDQIDSLPKDKTIIFICRSGNRSAQATAFALDKGFTSVYNMSGGMIFWNQIMLPTER